MAWLWLSHAHGPLGCQQRIQERKPVEWSVFFHLEIALQNDSYILIFKKCLLDILDNFFPKTLHGNTISSCRLSSLTSLALLELHSCNFKWQSASQIQWYPLNSYALWLFVVFDTFCPPIFSILLTGILLMFIENLLCPGQYSSLE